MLTFYNVVTYARKVHPVRECAGKSFRKAASSLSVLRIRTSKCRVLTSVLGGCPAALTKERASLSIAEEMGVLTFFGVLLRRVSDHHV